MTISDQGILEFVRRLVDSRLPTDERRDKRAAEFKKLAVMRDQVVTAMEISDAHFPRPETAESEAPNSLDPLQSSKKSSE
jgi:hypothetical protein